MHSNLDKANLISSRITQVPTPLACYVDYKFSFKLANVEKTFQEI